MQKTATNPPQVPRIDMLKRIPRFVRNPIPILTEYRKEHGPTYGLFIGGGQNKGIITFEPAVVQHVLQKKHRNYIKTYVQAQKLRYYVGDGLLTVNGNYWLQQRRLIQPGFHRDRLAQLVNLMQAAIDNYLHHFDQALQSGKTIDICHQMLELAFNIISRSLFSVDVDEKELQRLSDNITEIQEFFIREIRQPYLGWWFRLSGQLQKHKSLAENSKQLIREFIRQRKESGQQQDDLLDMLLSARYEGSGESMTEQQLLDEALILFVAGHETSANALSWTISLLARHPWAVQKIRHELQEIAGTEALSFAQLPQLTYLRQVIEESMRLYPPVWITDREALEADEAEGYKIAKGETVVAFIYGIHHNPELWPEPEKFDPDRFSPENKKRHIPYSYLPFGGGPRLCIGNNFAMMEMQLILASLLRRYDFQLLPNQDLSPLPLITLRPQNGIKVKVQKAAHLINPSYNG